MGGGLIQLITRGAQDEYLTAAPEMTFFKQVYRRHSNFAMESVRQTFMSKPTLGAQVGQFTCRINRVADLLQEVHLVVELPDVYSPDVSVVRNGTTVTSNYRFQWVRHFGQRMIYTASVRLDSQLIDSLYGEWMIIWNELTLSSDKREAFDSMSGNSADMQAPTTSQGYIHIINNQATFMNYPASTTGAPSIRGRTLVVPLPFWFTQNPALALPLVALQYQIAEVTLELQPIAQLYRVYDDQTGLHVSPSYFMSRYPTEDVSIARFLKDGASTIDLNAYLECNFIYLDDAERRLVALQPRDCLVERVHRAEREGISSVETVPLIFNNPIKELVFVMRRDDAIVNYNEGTNFMATIPEPSTSTDVDDILGTGKIIVNGMDRIEEKPAMYFGMIQPYQHHTRIPKRGIYCYSFARYPEKVQPSGTLNASKISRLQMYLTLAATVPSTTTYQAVVYGLSYNVFRVMGGSGSMVFVS